MKRYYEFVIMTDVNGVNYEVGQYVTKAKNPDDAFDKIATGWNRKNPNHWAKLKGRIK